MFLGIEQQKYTFFMLKVCNKIGFSRNNIMYEKNYHTIWSGRQHGYDSRHTPLSSSIAKAVDSNLV
jgi:hypothetical protein